MNAYFDIYGKKYDLLIEHYAHKNMLSEDLSENQKVELFKLHLMLRDVDFSNYEIIEAFIELLSSKTEEQTDKKTKKLLSAMLKNIGDEIDEKISDYNFNNQLDLEEFLKKLEQPIIKTIINNSNENPF